MYRKRNVAVSGSSSFSLCESLRFFSFLSFELIVPGTTSAKKWFYRLSKRRMLFGQLNCVPLTELEKKILGHANPIVL